MSADDPFRHLPGLRGKIIPHTQSFFRDFSVQKINELMEDSGGPTFPAYEDDEREYLRDEALGDHEGDLLIFAYGSLIWDPALDFADVRTAFAPDHSRRFILVDRFGGRGTEEAPGLMAALDDGDGCDGLVFRIAADKVDAETEILFRRELLGPCYAARHILVQVDGREETALAFVADHSNDIIESDISRADQIRYAATGQGVLGTSLDYLQNTVTQLEQFGIEDDDARDLLENTLEQLAQFD